MTLTMNTHTYGWHCRRKCTDEWQSMKDTTLYEWHYECQPTLVHMKNTTGVNALMNGNACIIENSYKWQYECQNTVMPPKKLLGGGFSTPYPVFSLICTIHSEITIFPDLYRSHVIRGRCVLVSSGWVRHPLDSKKLSFTLWMTLRE